MKTLEKTKTFDSDNEEVIFKISLNNKGEILYEKFHTSRCGTYSTMTEYKSEKGYRAAIKRMVA